MHEEHLGELLFQKSAGAGCIFGSVSGEVPIWKGLQKNLEIRILLETFRCWNFEKFGVSKVSLDFESDFKSFLGFSKFLDFKSFWILKVSLDFQSFRILKVLGS